MGNDKVTFTIICMNNNDEILNSWLLKSLNEQTYKNYQLIIINTLKKNGKSKFKSAYKALSSLNIKNCKGEYLLFCHNDIKFYKKDFLEKLANKISDIDFNIIGFAGMIENKEKEYIQYSSVLYGPGEKELKYTGNHNFKLVKAVQTVDECCFLIPKNRYRGFKNIGKTWDLYAVQYCLGLINDNKNESKIYVIDESIHHRSSGVYTRRYVVGLNGLRHFYRKGTPIIFTTCGIYDISLNRKDIFWNMGYDPNPHLLSRVFHFFFPNRHPFHYNKEE